jgi:hypothetical protein
MDVAKRTPYAPRLLGLALMTILSPRSEAPPNRRAHAVDTIDTVETVDVVCGTHAVTLLVCLEDMARKRCGVGNYRLLETEVGPVRPGELESITQTFSCRPSDVSSVRRE